MTLENCKRLMNHFEKLSQGEGIPSNHKDPELVKKNALVSYEEMKQRFLKKGGDLETAGDVNFSGMSKKELQEYAATNNIDVTSASTKDDLVVILENDSEAA